MCAPHLRDVSSPHSTAIGYESGTKLRLNVKQRENGKNIIEKKINGHKHSSKTSIFMGVADLPCSLAKPKVEESNTVCIEKALKRYLAKENTRPKKKKIILIELFLHIKE